MSECSLSSLCDTFLKVARDEESPPDQFQASLAALRQAILLGGLTEQPIEEVEEGDDQSKEKNTKAHGRNNSLRGKVWKALLGVEEVTASTYIQLIKEGESTNYRKIRNDSFRTFPNEEYFQGTVSEPEIIRVLNCFVLQYEPTFSYCQGMNTICAPFLFCMPEVEAYFTFCQFITRKFPLYWISSHIGAQAGCMLVDEVLCEVDDELFAHLQKHNLSAYLYAFSCISSLSASVPPFSELLKLWDFLVAFGPHFNILCVAAQIIHLRSDLLNSDSPKSILDYRKWPSLRARYIIDVAMSILPRLPEDLYNRICLHATDPETASEITGRAISFQD